ncbi:MAG TPA: type II toxin-antitoxin system HipA family toxin [Bryobacteraceae bacterium]|nr:type II toxin-antitoxin system HipA family toxin [Bryobacteraceae bacterium]
MARTLDVYLHADLVGHLTQDDDGDMSFQYLESWLQKAGAVPLSHSLPLGPERFRRKECRGFFAGILPEESKREMIARNLGISARNDYAMLEAIGGECAGAVTFLPHGEPMPDRQYGYRNLSDEELAAILKELPRRPLLAGEEGIRLSLAGAQDKVPVRVEERAISLPLGGAPSTHILKPNVERFEGVVFNEALCMLLAAAADLPAAAIETREVGGISYLLVERYDRHHRPLPDRAPVVERLHQEDFCQALGIVSEQKYQKEGGPSLKQCFALVREVSSAPVIDLAQLLDNIIFNYIVGNNDAHGKNFSLVYRPAGAGELEIRLSPLYDVVSTIYYPELSRDMAMRIGEQYSSEKVSLPDFEKLADDAKLGKPLVRTRLTETTERVVAALPNVPVTSPVAERVADLIRHRAERALKDFRRGK